VSNTQLPKLSSRGSWIRSVAVIVFLSVFSPISTSVTEARAVEPLQPVVDCSSTPQVACIEAIYLVNSDGDKIRAVLTGRVSAETRTYAPDSVLRAEWQEYSFKGVKFGGNSGGLFIPRVFYFPLGNKDCFYDPCVEGGEYFEFALSPTWLNGRSSDTPLSLPFRSSNRACGLKSNPSLCYPVDLFSTSSTFEFHVRTPSTFKTITSTGRGVQDFSISEAGEVVTTSGAIYKRVIVRAQPIVYSSYGLFGADIEEYAHYETDRFVFWLWGESDRRMRTLGRCFQTPKLSVVSNIFHAAFPQWDAKEESIFVNVAGPHYKSDGSVNYGLIQVKVSSALASCLWNVDIKSRVDAKVSVTYETSESEKVQTSSSRLVGNEFVLTISGVTFSSPTIRVKLVQGTATPASTSISSSRSSTISSETTTSAIKLTKMTIKCRKSKKIREFTAVKPRCPKGWTRS
jgi:hypothetical protein